MWMSREPCMSQLTAAAKEEAFQESTKLRNQFRSLAEDEVEFLDSVLETTRAQEAALRKETSDQLDVFRQQQEAADRASRSQLDESVAVTSSTEWTTAKKRKRPDVPAKGVKSRMIDGPKGSKSPGPDVVSIAPQAAASSLRLGDYSSDDD